MVVSIEVGLLPDSKDISFTSIGLSHAECEDAALTVHRQPTSGKYSLRCGCGLEIVLPDNGAAVALISKVAVGAEATQLELGTFDCNPSASVIYIVPCP